MAPSKPTNDQDFYEVLDLLPSATEKEIKKAYRKKALKCHPDKNPDNPQAAQEWERLSKALEVLTDTSAREAYDKVLKAKKAAELRNRELDSQRKKLKQDLEAREAASQRIKESAADAAKRLEREIKRLREEGSRILEEEQERLRKEVREAPVEESPKLRVKWKCQKGEEGNGGYSEEYLKECFEEYGEVTHIIVSRKKKGSAIIEFASVNGAERAVANVIGHTDNPLQVSWLSGRPTSNFYAMKEEEKGENFEQMVLEKMKRTQRMKDERMRNDEAERHQRGKDAKSTNLSESAENVEINEADILQKLKQARAESSTKQPSWIQSSNQFSFQTFKPFESSKGDAEDGFSKTGQQNFEEGNILKKSASQARDFETIAMRKLRQAEERRKLIEQMQREDADD
ncbi:DnaJ-like subfamily C member 17 [Holothuria leucospilota]|uniref:DnaJ-like subfamily C member 17 n=1 Tax=Holothuria leucospilota TaxID=206669 RepID=A0A9Q1CHR7_HOLLE|nr:DnaJ-like subfamily C member 17 [Holothuria leucospilota]